MVTNPTRPAPLFDRHGIELPSVPKRRSGSCSHLVAKLYRRNLRREKELALIAGVSPVLAHVLRHGLEKPPQEIDDRHTRSKRRIRLPRQTLRALFAAQFQRP